MKKIIIAVFLVLFGLGFYSDGYCMSMSKDIKVRFGLEELTVPCFYNFNNFYGGALLQVMDYRNLISLDVSYIANSLLGEEYIGAGLSLDLQNFSNSLGIHYRLPAPFKIGTFAAIELSLSKWIAGVYLGIGYEIQK